jgi:hypothetical protein
MSLRAGPGQERRPGKTHGKRGFAGTGPGSRQLMTGGTENESLDRLLGELFVGHERVTVKDIRRWAVAAELPAELRSRLDRLPEGEYAWDEVAEALHGAVG